MCLKVFRVSNVTQRRAALVFVFFLALLLPLPICVNGQSYFLPFAWLVQIICQQPFWLDGNTIQSWLGALSLNAGFQFVALCAAGFIWYGITKLWPMRVRGSITGLIIFTVLLSTSTFSLYSGPAGKQSLQDIYHLPD